VPVVVPGGTVVDVAGLGLGDTDDGLHGAGDAEPAAPAWHPGWIDCAEPGCIVLAVSGAGVPFGEMF